MSHPHQYTLIWTATFRRTAKKFLLQHPELVTRFLKRMEQLQHDPFMPKLRLHPLSGKLNGKMSISLTYSYRVVLILKKEDKEITLLDIGSHDKVY